MNITIGAAIFIVLAIRFKGSPIDRPQRASNDAMEVVSLIVVNRFSPVAGVYSRRFYGGKFNRLQG